MEEKFYYCKISFALPFAFVSCHIKFRYKTRKTFLFLASSNLGNVNARSRGLNTATTRGRK